MAHGTSFRYRVLRQDSLLCAVVLVLALSAAAHADTGTALPLRRLPPGRKGELELEVRAYLQGDTDSGADFALTWTQLRSYADLGGGWRGALDVDRLDFDSRDPRVPAHLTDVSIAAGLRIADLGSRWELFGTLGAGHASDRTFDDDRGWYAKGSVSATRGFRKLDRLGIFLDFDGNRGVYPDLPLPGASYQWFVSEELVLILGFPLTRVLWRPTTKLEIAAGGIAIFSGRLEAVATYSFTEAWALFARYAAEQRPFHVEGTPRDERLQYGEMRAELGCRWRPTKETQFSLTAGFAFDRTLESVDREGDELSRLSASDEAFLACDFAWRF
jgi:hypothetical protein